MSGSPPRAALAALVAVALAAVATMAAECATLRAAAPNASTVAPAAPATAGHPALAMIDADDLVRTILDRPVFTPDRRRAPPPAGHADTPPRLAGLVATPAVTTALFAAEHVGDRDHVLRIGDTIAGWTLLRADAHQAWVGRDGHTLRLIPRFDDTPPPVLTPPPVPLAHIAVLATKRTNPQLAW